MATATVIAARAKTPEAISFSRNDLLIGTMTYKSEMNRPGFVGGHLIKVTLPWLVRPAWRSSARSWSPSEGGEFFRTHINFHQ